MFTFGYGPGLYRFAGLFNLVLCATLLCAQTGPTATPQQTPHTSQQTKEVLPSYEGQNVSSVELAGQPDLNTDSLQPLLVQKANQPFSQAKVDQSVEALRRTGRFHDAQIQIRPEPAGVRVLFVLEPAVYFGVYSFPGAEQRFAYTRLLQIAQYPPRGAYTSVDVSNAQKALERFLQREGYFQSKVTIRIVTDKVHGLANVSFDTDLGRKAKFGTVTITGATPQDTALLESKVHSFRARLRNSAIRKGKTYSLKTLQNATDYLQNSLMSKDHLDAKVKLISANYNAANNHADITFNVQAGPLVHVKVQGAHVWSWTKKKLLPVYQQVGIDPEIIQEGRTNLTSHFQSKGYFDAKVNVTTQKQPDGETIVYEVVKGPRHKVKDVDVAGNQTLKEDELLQHVPVKKARLITHGSYSEKLIHTSVKNLQRVYQANGFSDVKVTPEVHNEAGNIRVTFRVVEGERDVVEAMHIQGIQSQSLYVLAPKGLNLATGKPYSQRFVQEDRNTLMASYLKLGYLNASFRQTAKPIDKDKHRLEVTYLIEEGPQVRTASVVTLGRDETEQWVINKVAPIRAEAPLREDDMLANESQLYNLGVFDWAEIDPRRRITTQTEEDVLVKVHEAKKNDLTYGFGFDVINRGGSIPSGTVAVPGLPVLGVGKDFKTNQKTFYGPRALIQYTRKDLWGKAHTISFNALGSRLDQRGAIAYTDPYFRGSNWASSFNIGGEHDAQNPIFTSVIGQAGWQMQHALNQDKTTNLFLRYNYSQTGLTDLLIPDLVPPSDRHVRLSTLSAVYVRDTRDFQLDAHKGIYETFEAHFNPSFLGSNFNFGKFLAQTAYYKSLTKQKIVWANSVRFGFAEAFSDHVPLSETFFTGGPNTLRGFALNGAGPQRVVPACGNPADPSTCVKITVPVGGNQLFLVNSEFRIPLPIKQGLGIVPFYDGGNVFRTIGFHGQYTNTAGLGFRYATPVGPIRVDFGYNLNAPPGVKSWQYFITIGQAF